MKLDLNCDLGEGEPLSRTRALMRWITSANVACGGHAGKLRTMEACVRLAKQLGVRLGAHPGPWDRADFGRGRVRLVPDDFQLLLMYQVGALEKVAQANGVRLHHIKLHGALYHASEEDEVLAGRYAAVVKRFWPRAKIYARASGRVARIARGSGLAVWEEAFADRGYRDDGTMFARGEPNALVTDPMAVVERIRLLLDRGEIAAVSGRPFVLNPQTLCIHSDTPEAVRIARAVAEALRAGSGITREAGLRP